MVSIVIILFVGPSAGNFSTAGFNVTAVGYNAANATASGDGHIVAIGDNAIKKGIKDCWWIWSLCRI